MAQSIISNMPFAETVALLQDKYQALPQEATVFSILSTEYDENGNVSHDFLELIEEATQIGYQFVNTIVYPTVAGQTSSFYDNARYVVWLCKQTASMKICKDAIREKHIWKDVEWGKRAKNYNPKGKDPGNVWIPTLDDGNAHITDHILLDNEGVIRRLLSLADCGDDYELFQKDRPICRPQASSPSHPAHGNGSCQGRVYFKSSEDMGAIEDGSVSVVVTSPPYWDLKDYFKPGQIGQEPYDVYLARMKTVWQECFRKLTPTGSLWININMRMRGGKVIAIPRDFVKMCREMGFYYKGIFIWHKSSGIPTGEKNIVDRHEYVLVFSKEQSVSLDRGTQESFCDYKNPAINGGTFWNINRKAGSVGKKYIHPAIYPNELVSRIVRLASAEGDTVLDPFLGSGTSLIAALGQKRNFVGYEFNEGFRELMESRYASELPEDAVVHMVE